MKIKLFIYLIFLTAMRKSTRNTIPVTTISDPKAIPADLLYWKILIFLQPFEFLYIFRLSSSLTRFDFSWKWMQIAPHVMNKTQPTRLMRGSCTFRKTLHSNSMKLCSINSQVWSNLHPWGNWTRWQAHRWQSRRGYLW